MGLFPSPYPVAHIARTFDHLELDPDTGNEVLVESAPVVRYAQEISQTGKGSSSDVLSAEFADRVESTITMSVDDSTVYKTSDQVILFPEISGGQYVAGTGVAFWVDGEPSDQRDGPWGHMFKGFGGVVTLKRVT